MSESKEIVKNIITRKATESDKSKIFDLYKNSMQMFIETIWDWDDEWQKNDFNKNWELCSTKVIEAYSEFSGYLQTEDRDDSIYIKMIIFMPEQRSKGYGSEIIKNLQQKALLNNKKLKLQVFKQNKKAINFYRNHGFKTITTEPNWLVMEL